MEQKGHSGHSCRPGGTASEHGWRRTLAGAEIAVTNAARAAGAREAGRRAAACKPGGSLALPAHRLRAATTAVSVIHVSSGNAEALKELIHVHRAVVIDIHHLKHSARDLVGGSGQGSPSLPYLEEGSCRSRIYPRALHLAVEHPDSSHELLIVDDPVVVRVKIPAQPNQDRSGTSGWTKKHGLRRGRGARPKHRGELLLVTVDCLDRSRVHNGCSFGIGANLALIVWA